MTENSQLSDDVLDALRAVDILSVEDTGLIFGRHPGAVLREAFLLLTHPTGSRCLECKGRGRCVAKGTPGEMYPCPDCSGRRLRLKQPRPGDALREDADWLQLETLPLCGECDGLGTFYPTSARIEGEGWPCEACDGTGGRVDPQALTDALRLEASSRDVLTLIRK